MGVCQPSAAVMFIRNSILHFIMTQLLYTIVNEIEVRTKRTL